MARVIDFVVPKGQMFGGAGVATLTTYRKKPSASETDGLNQPLDLNNLPFDPAQEAMRESKGQKNTPLEADYDPIEEAMKRHPGLTKEEALKIAEASGF